MEGALVPPSMREPPKAQLLTEAPALPVLTTKEYGFLAAWGNGSEGQLGNGREASYAVPVLVDSVRTRLFRQLVCGALHSAALLDSGEVLTWGLGDEGQLGHGARGSDARPRRIEALSSVRIAYIACGGAHSAAISENGELFTWGRGTEGQLGHGDGGTRTAPTRVERLGGVPLGAVSCGLEHTACITADRMHVYTWGRGDRGQLGHGDERDQRAPELVRALEGLRVARVSCGAHSTAVISEAREVLLWGLCVLPSQAHAQSQQPEAYVNKPMPMAALGGREARGISLGAFHAAVLIKGGEVWTWALAPRGARSGQLGRGGEPDPDPFTPKQVKALSGRDVRAIACGNEHTAVLTAAGHLCTFGRGSSGALGHGDGQSGGAPRPVEALSPSFARLVAAGGYHTLCWAIPRRSEGSLAPPASSGNGARHTPSPNSPSGEQHPPETPGPGDGGGLLRGWSGNGSGRSSGRRRSSTGSLAAFAPAAPALQSPGPPSAGPLAAPTSPPPRPPPEGSGRPPPRPELGARRGLPALTVAPRDGYPNIPPAAPFASSHPYKTDSHGPGPPSSDRERPLPAPLSASSIRTPGSGSNAALGPHPFSPPSAPPLQPGAPSSAAALTPPRTARSTRTEPEAAAPGGVADAWDHFQRRMRELEENLPFSYARLLPAYEALRRKLAADAVATQRLRLEVASLQEERSSLERRLREALAGGDARAALEREREAREAAEAEAEAEARAAAEARQQAAAAGRELERMEIRERTLRERLFLLEEENAALSGHGVFPGR